MGNKFDEMQSAISEARAVFHAADAAAGVMAAILKGRLRHVPAWRLKELKIELNSFNAHTGRWKD